MSIPSMNRNENQNSFALLPENHQDFTNYYSTFAWCFCCFFFSLTLRKCWWWWCTKNHYKHSPSHQRLCGMSEFACVGLCVCQIVLASFSFFLSSWTRTYTHSHSFALYSQWNEFFEAEWVFVSLFFFTSSIHCTNRFGCNPTQECYIPANLKW